eukprot:5345776-Amphidinium_carterae.1
MEWRLRRTSDFDGGYRNRSEPRKDIIPQSKSETMTADLGEILSKSETRKKQPYQTAPPAGERKDNS